MPDLKTPLPILVGAITGEQLDLAIHVLESPPGSEEAEFGLVRVRERALGPHKLIHQLVSFGNGTSEFDFKTWRATTTHGEGEFASLDPDRRHYEGNVSLAAQLFEHGHKGSLSWYDQRTYFEARAVRISERSCLNCHTNSNVGDIVSILVGKVSSEQFEELKNSYSQFESFPYSVPYWIDHSLIKKNFQDVTESDGRRNYRFLDTFWKYHYRNSG